MPIDHLWPENKDGGDKVLFTFSTFFVIRSLGFWCMRCIDKILEFACIYQIYVSVLSFPNSDISGHSRSQVSKEYCSKSFSWTIVAKFLRKKETQSNDSLFDSSWYYLYTLSPHTRTITIITINKMFKQ